MPQVKQKTNNNNKNRLSTTASYDLSIQSSSIGYYLMGFCLLVSIDNGIIILSTVLFLSKRLQDIKEL